MKIQKHITFILNYRLAPRESRVQHAQVYRYEIFLKHVRSYLKKDNCIKTPFV